MLTGSSDVTVMQQYWFSLTLFLFAAFGKPSIASDTIKLQNTTDFGEVTVLISGRIEKRLLPFLPFWENLVCDTIQKSSHSATILLGKNFVPPGECPATLVVFSENNAIKFVNPFTPPEITTSALDEIPVDLDSIHKMKVSIWVAACESEPGKECDEAPGLQGEACQEESNIICEEARQEIEITNMILKNQRAGIELEYSEILDISCGPNDEPGCKEVQSVCPPPDDRVFFTSDSLNIYYVRTGTGSDQICHCTAADLAYCILNGISQTIYLTSYGTSPKTLTHEVGHAFSLGHIDKSRNIMKAGTDNNRCRFLDGQRFRMSVYEVSLLNHPGAGGPRDPDEGTCALPGISDPSDGEVFPCPSSTSFPWNGEISCYGSM
jgi:hypothetical protein